MLLAQIRSYSVRSEKAPCIEKELGSDIGQVPTSPGGCFPRAHAVLILNLFST